MIRFLLPILLLLSQISFGAETDDIGRIADSYVTSGQVPGVLIGIWKSGSAPVFITRGVSDLTTGAPMAPGNSQRIGSITKSMTITRILQLADDGKVSLDDPISKYVPDLRNGNATLRELANMTSGIFEYTQDGPFIQRIATHLTQPVTDEQIVAAANRHAPYFAPGKRWYYSNTNTVLLGMVVERVTGRPLREELARFVFGPLKLSRTLLPTGILLPPPFCHGYAVLDTDVGQIDITKVSPTFFSGAGAVVSTANDLRLWGRALARGSLVSRKAQAERLKTIFAAGGVGPFYDRYGLGLGLIDGWIGHTGDLFGYQSLVMHNLLADETVVIFVNGSGPVHVPTKIFQAITSILPTARPAQPVSTRIIGKRVRTTVQPTIQIRGQAFSEAGVLLVQYAQGSGPFQSARGASSWRFTARLAPGSNLISVRTTDLLGRKSRITKLRIVRN